MPFTERLKGNGGFDEVKFIEGVFSKASNGRRDGSQVKDLFSDSDTGDAVLAALEIEKLMPRTVTTPAITMMIVGQNLFI